MPTYSLPVGASLRVELLCNPQSRSRQWNFHRERRPRSFIADQQRSRAGAGNVVRISDGMSGLSTATIKRRLAAVSSLFSYLVIRGDAGVATNPVPRGMPTRKSRHRGQRGVPLVPGVRRLPRILAADEVELLVSVLRTDRDRAMAQAMLLGGLRRCEVLGLRFEDLRVG